MRQNFWIKPCVALVCGSLLFSCSEDSDPVTETEVETIFDDVLSSYTDNTVVYTYSQMATNAMALAELTGAMTFSTLTDAQIVSAADAWKSTREHWEKSEAFLFGPAAYNNLDPKLDSWPLDKDKLDQQLALIADDSSEPTVASFDAAYVGDNLGYTLQGFHAVEYMLFADGAARSASSYTEAELAYLKAIASVLSTDCITLEGWWIGGENLSAAKQAHLGDDEIWEGLTCFGDEIKNAGNAGSRYSSQISAIEELIEGAKAIADEVGNAKIADPIESQNVLDVESWYSYNSITDFVNNISSIENMYLGTASTSATESLSDLIVANDADLDAEFKAAIADAKTKIEAIGVPFRDNLDNTTGAAAATEACGVVDELLSEVLSVLSNL